MFDRKPFVDYKGTKLIDVSSGSHNTYSRSGSAGEDIFSGSILTDKPIVPDADFNAISINKTIFEYKNAEATTYWFSLEQKAQNIQVLDVCCMRCQTGFPKDELKVVVVDGKVGSFSANSPNGTEVGTQPFSYITNEGKNCGLQIAAGTDVLKLLQVFDLGSNYRIGDDINLNINNISTKVLQLIEANKSLDL